MTDFTVPRRMSASAFVIIFLKTFRYLAVNLFFVAILLTVRYDDSLSFYGILTRLSVTLAVIIAISLLVAFAKYYFQKFHIEDGKLVTTHGLISKKTTSIPLPNVHNLRTRKGIAYRILNMRGISFDTLADEKSEVELILSESDWQALLRNVSNGENAPEASIDAENATAMPPAITDDTYAVSDIETLKGALCQNHLRGLAVLAAVLFPLLDNINQLGNDVVGRFLDFIDSEASDAINTPVQWICLLVALYLLIAVLWTGKTMLRYGNMLIATQSERLTIESGLLSRFTCRLSRDKATIFSLKQNPLEKLAGFRTVTLLQAGNATQSKNEGDIRIYGSDYGSRLLSWWLDKPEDGNDETLFKAASGTGLFFRKSMIGIFVIVAATCALIHFGYIPEAIILCSICTAAVLIRAYLARKHSSIVLADSYILVNCGNIAQIHKYVKYSDVEDASIQETPLTHRTSRVSLTISTNAGSLTVRSLKKNEAQQIRSILLG